MANLCHLNSRQITLGIKNGDFSAEEYVSQILERIEKIDSKINAFITVDNEGALEKAQLIKYRSTCRCYRRNKRQYMHKWFENNVCFENIRRLCSSL
jgi:Asp-tRNA(Asn)/Glu-tRNA(Gln) amidotransferase A subunit family amidase